MSPPLPAGRDLLARELGALAIWLGEREALWRPHVRHDPRQRTFHRLVADPHVTAWLICWMPGHDTGFHDHDGSAGAVVVLQGLISEARLTVRGEARAQVYGPGEVLAFGPADIHRVRHHGFLPSTTIHAYSPTLRTMGAYVADERGRLQRHELAEDTELGRSVR